MRHAPLASLYLCEDCNEVGDNSRYCACCGSQAIVNLACLLNLLEGTVLRLSAMEVDELEKLV